jgi:ligand-binding sensor domain-containing protein
MPYQVESGFAGGSITVRVPASLGGMSSVGATIARLFTIWQWRSMLALLVLVANAPLALAAPVEQGPAPQYRSIIRNYGPEQGFSQNAVNALLQGRDGYLWIGTFGGLVRFDGSTFVTLRATHGKSAQQDPRDSGGPGSDRIVALREDARGRIWIGTEDAGLSLYDHGRFRQLPICGGTCKVHSISPQAGQALWVTTNTGLIRVATDSLRSVLIREAMPRVYSEVVIGSDGHTYLSGSGKLGRVVGDNIRSVSLPDGVVSAWQILAANKYIWVVTDKGIYRFDPLQNVWKAKFLRKGTRMLESQGEGLWVITDTGELLHEDHTGELQPVRDAPAIYTNAIWQDRTGVLWMGSNSKGLWSMQASKAMTLEKTDALAAFAGSGRAVIGDKSGGLWLGYGCGGVHHRLKDGTYETSRARAIRKSQCVTGLLQDADGALWVGTVDAGLQRVADYGVETLPQSLNLSNVQIWMADGGDYWVASDGHTFNLRRTGDKYTLSPPVAALEGLTIRKMAMARKGGIWLVGDQGAIRLDKNRVVERWTPAEGLSSRFARSLYEDDRGVLWIGTYGGGLNRIENGRITHYDENNGLFDDTVSCILADKTGQMWLGGNRGISVLPTASQQGLGFETVPFAISAGDVTFELNGGLQSSCHQDEEGYLWFSLVKGFAKVDPAKLVEISALQPEAHIERVVVAGAKRNPRETVVLGTSMQPLEIGYTAINLTSPDQLSFRYRISGADAQWTQTGNTRNLVINDVPWGEHVFEVQARNRGGSWSPAASLKISRPVPWYRRQWLWPLIALLALLALIWRTRDHALSAAHDERLQRMSAQKLLDQEKSLDRL